MFILQVKKIKIELFAFLFAVFCFSAAAQELNSVTFEQTGTYHFGDDILKFNVQSRKGAMYDEHVVNDDIKRLHGTGFFEDVVSETVKRPDGRIDLIFKIVPRASVHEVRFEGNEKYDSDKLREQIQIGIGAPLNDKQFSEALNSLREFYTKNGHNEAVITPEIIPVGDGTVDIVFKVKENLQLKVHRVYFPGAQAYTESELRDSILNRYSLFYWVPLLNLGLLEKSAIEEDILRLRERYLEKGYLDFTVKEVQFNPLADDPEFVDIVFEIEEGEPYTVGEVSVKGAERFPNEELMERVKIASGETFDVRREKASAAALEGKYSPLGYVDFNVNPVRVPDYRNHKVDLVFDIHEGLPYKVRDVFISGNKWTKDHVIRRELIIAPGDPVDKDRIEASRSRLLGMGYFEKVDTAAVNSPVDGTKDVDIHVKEKNFLNAKIGAGISDTDSLAGMVELSHTNMDILDPMNYFTGGGQRMRVLALVGIERMDFEADFTEPWLFGIPLRWEVSGYMRNVIYENWDERRIGVTTSLTKRIFDDFTSISGGYTFENVKVHDMDRDMSEIFQEEEGSSYVGRFQVSLNRDTRDNALDPTSGYNVNALGAVSSRIFGGSNNYYRFELKGINHMPFFDKMIILTTAAKIGSIGSIGSPHEDPPIYERYFLGGGDSVRGFPYRSIGPTDSRDDNYGGDFMYLITAEVSHPIWKFIRGAAFIDIGNVTHSRFGPFSDPNIGAGYGLRIRLPMVNAPIRLDFAYPILNNQDGVRSKLRFHFNMGFSMF